jgi:hypothetical protein
MATTTLIAMNLSRAEDKQNPEIVLENRDDEMTEEERKHDQDGQASKRNARNHCVKIQRNKSRKVKKRTLESFLFSESLRALADEVTKRAREYKEDFERVEELSNKDLTRPGSIAQVFAALQATKQSKGDETRILFPEAFQAALSYSSMQEATQALTDAGVPMLMSFELTRRVLDAEIPNSKPFYVVSEEEGLNRRPKRKKE